MYPLQDIDTVPVTLIIGRKDNICQARYAYEAADLIQSTCNIITLNNSHLFPVFGAIYNNIMADELDLTKPCRGEFAPGFASVNTISTLFTLILPILFY